MSVSEGQAHSMLDDLRVRVDDLATRLALQGVTNELIEDLTKFCEQASKTIDSGKGPFTSSGSRNHLPAGPELEKLVEAEIIRLQEVIELSTQQKPEMTETSATTSPKPGPRVAPLAQDIELVGDFVVEARDHLVSIETQMLVLEQNTTDLPAIHSVFRAFHTIKGLAGFLEFEDIQCVAHEVETLLDLARNGTLSITTAIVDVVLSGADYLKEALAGVDDALANKSSRVIADYDGLLAKIKEAMNGDPVKSETASTQEQASPAKSAKPSTAVEDPVSDTVKSKNASAQKQKTQAKRVKPSVSVEKPATTPTKSEIASTQGQATAAESVKASAAVENLISDTEKSDSISAHGPQAGSEKPSVSIETPANTPKAEGRPSKSQENFSIRVDTVKLDHLMDMVGEMVIAQSLIHHNRSLTSVQDARLQRDLSQLARITNEVQRTTMGMRMLPVGQLFQRTARLVRDLSRRAGKQVELETSGEETEVDKTIAEELADPLMHMVRNAIDHGIETPAEREAAGKNPTARVRLAAYHQGGRSLSRCGMTGED